MFGKVDSLIGKRTSEIFPNRNIGLSNPYPTISNNFGFGPLSRSPSYTAAGNLGGAGFPFDFLPYD